MKNTEINQLLDSLTAAQVRSQYWDPALADLLGRTCSEIGALRAAVARLKSTPALVSSLAEQIALNDSVKKLAAKPTPAPASAEKTFADKLDARRSNLVRDLERFLCHPGLDHRNLVIRHQAEEDVTCDINASLRQEQFPVVHLERVYLEDGFAKAMVRIPAGRDGFVYCSSLQKIFSNKLRCVPA